jgi:hypothetical protein
MVDMELESELIFLENRIRDLISNLVSPLITKVESHEKLLEKLKKHDVKHKIRNNDLEEKMQRSLNRLVPLEDFNKKMFDVFSETRSLEHSTTRRLEQFNSSINQLTHHFEYLKVSYKTMEEVQSNNEKMFKTSEKSIRETKDSVKRQMTVIENLLQKHIYETAHLLESLNGKVDSFGYKLGELNEKSMPSLQFFIKKVKENNDILTQKVEGLTKERVTLKDIKEFKFRMETDNSNMRNRLNTDLKNINSFFDKALKFAISSEIYEVFIETSQLDHLTFMGPVIRSDLRQTCTLIEESRDMKSENYQLPQPTLSFLMHLKRVYEKQLKVIEEKKSDLEFKKTTEAKFLAPLSVDVKNDFESSAFQTPHREVPYLNSPSTKKNFKDRAGSFAIDESPKSKPVIPAELFEKNETLETSPKASPLASTAKTEIRLKSVNLSIEGQTQISIERTSKNNIQNVLDLKITPNYLIRSQLSKESFESWESRPFSGASNLRESFLMVPPQIYQKSSTPLPLLPIKEKSKNKKKEIDEEFEDEPFVESSESENLEESQKRRNSQKGEKIRKSIQSINEVERKSEKIEVKKEGFQERKEVEGKNEDDEVKKEKNSKNTEEISEEKGKNRKINKSKGVRVLGC